MLETDEIPDTDIATVSVQRGDVDPIIGHGHCGDHAGAVGGGDGEEVHASEVENEEGF